MEGDYQWTEQIDMLLDMVGDSIDSAGSLLAAALRHLESPSTSRTGDNLITLVDASRDLTGAAACLKAAIGPCSSISAPACTGAASSLATSIRKVVEVMERSEDALRAIDRCRGHLGAAKLLLMGHPGVPGFDGCVEAEGVAAVRALEDALGATRGGGG